MPAPKIIKPQNDSKHIVAYSEALPFEWEKIPGADYYRLTVYDEKDNVVKSEKVNGTKVKLELLEGCGHSPQIQLPEEFSQIIINFLKK